MTETPHIDQDKSTADYKMFGFSSSGTRVTNFVIFLPTGRVATRTVDVEDEPDIDNWVSASTMQALEWLRREDLVYVPGSAYSDTELPPWIRQPQSLTGNEVETLIRRAKKISKFAYFEQTCKNLPRLIFHWPAKFLSKSIDIVGGLIGTLFSILLFVFIVIGLFGLLWFGAKQVLQ